MIAVGDADAGVRALEQGTLGAAAAQVVEQDGAGAGETLRELVPRGGAAEGTGQGQRAASKRVTWHFTLENLCKIVLPLKQWLVFFPPLFFLKRLFCNGGRDTICERNFTTDNLNSVCKCLKLIK